MGASIVVAEQGALMVFSFDDMMRYHGPGSPGGVAHGFKVLERALPLLADAPPERREITISTAFAGPGARDAIELVTRAVSEKRYVVDPSLALPERGRARERFVFTLGHGGESVTVGVRDGYVSEDFVDLARVHDRTAAQEERLARMKLEMADRVMAAPAADVYEVLG